MLLEPRSRFFLRHNLQFRTPRNAGVPLPFQGAKDQIDVENVLAAAIQKNRANLVLRNSDIVRLTHLDVRRKQDLAVMLFRRSDPDAANPIFENERTRVLRPADKRPDEAIAVSAHLFVRLSGIKDAAHPTYRAILEEVPGLTRTYIQALLHDQISSVRYNYTDSRGAEKETYTIADLLGVKSERVSGALKGKSYVPSITLVRPGSVEGLDTEGLVVPREERLKLIIKAEPNQTLGVIRKIQTWMKGRRWSKLLLELDMPEQRKRLVALAREADAADVLFVRSVPVQVKNDLQACTDRINEELVEKALELFDEDDE